MGHAKVQVPHKAVLILEFVSHSGSGPAPLQVVTLIFESSAIDVGDGVEWGIKPAAGLVDRVHIRAPMVVLETGEAMLPARRARNCEFHAGEQIVLTLPLLRIRRHERSTIKVPLALHSRKSVGMAHPQAQR